MPFILAALAVGSPRLSPAFYQPGGKMNGEMSVKAVEGFADVVIGAMQKERWIRAVRAASPPLH